MVIGSYTWDAMRRGFQTPPYGCFYPWNIRGFILGMLEVGLLVSMLLMELIDSGGIN